MEENLEETKGKKKLFKDKKNIAITILAILLMFSMVNSSQTSVETSANLTSDLNKKEQIIQANQKQIDDLQKENNRLKSRLKIKEKECEKLKAKIEYVFSDDSPNFDYFCDICVAKYKCNQNCCFEQIKELIYEVK